jgi:hypothetical protein
LFNDDGTLPEHIFFGRALTIGRYPKYLTLVSLFSSIPPYHIVVRDSGT